MSIAGTLTGQAARDRDADFDRLFLAEYSRVVRIAQRVLGSSGEAEDVAQEVFYAYYRQHRSDAAYAAAWLHRAAVHTSLNTIRGRGRRQEREKRQAFQQEPLQDAGQAAMDPQRAIEVAEDRRLVQEALRRLPTKSATVLALRYSGLSYAETADALNVGIGQVGTLLRRAEAALRKELSHAPSR